MKNSFNIILIIFIIIIILVFFFTLYKVRKESFINNYDLEQKMFHTLSLDEQNHYLNTDDVNKSVIFSRLAK